LIKLRGSVWWADFRRPDGSRVRKSLGTADRKEAKLLEAKLVANDKTATKNQATKGGLTISLEAAFKRAKRERREWVEAKDFKSIEAKLGLISKDFSKETDLSHFTYQVVLEYTEKLKESGLAASTINQRLSFLSVLINMAAANWGLPLAPFKMPRGRPKKGRIRTLSFAEEEKAIALFQKNTWKWHEEMALLVPCLLDTGCRLSEMLNLDIDRDVSWERNTVYIWENKADHPRSIPMTSRVREILARRADLGKPFRMLTTFSAAVCWDWVRTEMNLGDDKEFVLHALRHTTASRLAAAGMDSFRIQKWMGHKNIATTMIYVTLFANDLNDLVGVLDRGANRAADVCPERDQNVIDIDAHEVDEEATFIGGTLGISAKYGPHNPLVPSSTLGGGHQINGRVTGNYACNPFCFLALEIRQSTCQGLAILNSHLW